MRVPVSGLKASLNEPVPESWGEGHRCLVSVRQPLPKPYDFGGLALGDKRLVTQLHEGLGQVHGVMVATVTVWPQYVLKEKHNTHTDI